jgi:hypothetical protein
MKNIYIFSKNTIKLITFLLILLSSNLSFAQFTGGVGSGYFTKSITNSSIVSVSPQNACGNQLITVQVQDIIGLTQIHAGQYSFTNFNVVDDSTITFFLDADSIFIGTLSFETLLGTVNSDDTITIFPMPSVQMLFSDTICVGANYLISAVAQNNSAFSWSENGFGNLSNGNTLSPTYNSVNFDADSIVEIVISLSGINGCATETKFDTLKLFVSAPLQAQNIVANNNNTTICQGTSISASFNNGSGGSGTIVNENEFSIDGGTTWSNYTPNTVINTDAFSGNNILKIRTRRWSSNTTCDTSAWNEQSWTVTPLLPAPATFELAQAEVCQGEQNVLYTVSAVPNATSYQWTFPQGISVSGIDDLRQITLNFSDTAQSGSISVSAVDSCGAGASISINVIVNPNPVGTISSINETCSSSNGSITIDNIVGGSGSYSYLWNNNETSSTISNLSAGNYGVVLFDDVTGCSSNFSASIVNFASPTLSVSSTNTTCGNSDGTATVNLISSNGPVDFLWSNGNTSNQISNLAATSYNITATDSNNCETTLTAFIGNINGPSIDSVFQISASCPSNCNGIIGIVVSGGTTPYNYIWNADTLLTQATINNACYGSYFVEASDNTGCIVSANLNLGVSGANPNINGVITRPGGLLVTDGDVEIFLYRVSSDTAVFPTLEAQTLTNTGLFSLTNFDIGNFIVVAKPVISSSVTLENTLTTYYEFTNRWDSATVLNAACNFTTNFNLVLLEKPTMNGNATISGRVFSITGGNKRDRAVSVPDADIHIDREPQGIAVGNTVSDNDGRYQFDNINVGVYRVTVDIPGLPMINSHIVEVTPDGVIYGDRNFFVDSVGGIDIDSVPISTLLKFDELNTWSVFPNPFIDLLNIEVDLNKNNTEVEIEIVDVLGRKIENIYSGKLNEGNHKFYFNLKENHSESIYFVRMIMNDKVLVKSVVGVK